MPRYCLLAMHALCLFSLFQKKRDGSGRKIILAEKLKRYQHLRPHFATNFTDFLHEDCKQYVFFLCLDQPTVL